MFQKLTKGPGFSITFLVVLQSALHRTMEWFFWKGLLKVTDQLPSMGWGTIRYISFLKPHWLWPWSFPRMGHLRLPGNLIPIFTTNFFPYVQSKPTLIQSKTVAPCPVSATLPRPRCLQGCLSRMLPLLSPGCCCTAGSVSFLDMLSQTCFHRPWWTCLVQQQVHVGATWLWISPT